MAPREKSLGAVVVSSLVEILARSAPRSERDPDLEATTAKLAMHPVTGTFADPADDERLLYGVSGAPNPEKSRV